MFFPKIKWLIRALEYGFGNPVSMILFENRNAINIFYEASVSEEL